MEKKNIPRARDNKMERFFFDITNIGRIIVELKPNTSFKTPVGITKEFPNIFFKNQNFPYQNLYIHNLYALIIP